MGKTVAAELGCVCGEGWWWWSGVEVDEKRRERHDDKDEDDSRSPTTYQNKMRTLRQ